MDLAAAPKGKRRQHVACDACKLRRIKCDLVTLLPSRLDGEGSEHLPSFREQVRRHPNVQCTNCIKKDFRCTTEAIRNPAPPKKTGKTLDKLRERNKWSFQQGCAGKEDSLEVFEDSDSDDTFTAAGGSGDRQSNVEVQAALLPREQPPIHLFESRTSRNELEAYTSWRSMIENLPTITANAPPLSPTTAARHDDITLSHGTRVDFGPIASGSSIIWSEPTYGLVGSAGSFREAIATQSWPVKQTGTDGELEQLEGRMPSSRKRRVGSHGQVVKLDTARGPWHLWGSEDEIVVWGRREIVQERLADRALGLELSRHLISMYFQVVNHAFPAVNPESFYIEWMRAGQRSDHMSPSHEALCAILEAWGAQFSDNPIVLGLTASQRAPIVWKEDGTTSLGSNQIQWGLQRLTVCRALGVRAARLIDYSGLYRRPTITGIQALLMYSMLCGVGAENSVLGGNSAEMTLPLSALVDQMTHLNLMWDSLGPIPVDPSELPSTAGQMRNKQRQIFWSVMVTDSLHAADHAQMPKIPEADIEAAGKWLNVVQQTLPVSSFKLVAYFMRCFYRLALVARRIARELAIPNLRPGSVDVSSFCNSIRSQWAEIKSLHREITRQSTEVMENCASTMGYGFPLTRLVTLRLACLRMLFLQHQQIQTQLDFRRQLVNQISSTGNLQTEHIAFLEELQVQSADVLLQGSRMHVDVFEVILPTGILQTATLFVRALVATALFMAAIPTNEQGYPTHTDGGCGWTWDVKKHNIGVCIDALNQLGWAWSNIQGVLNAVNTSMEQTAPSPEALASVKTLHYDERIIGRREEERKEDRKSMQLALAHWPPESVPRLIDSAMAGLDIHNASPGEIARRLAPENLHAQAVQRRHKHDQVRIASSSGRGIEAMMVDPPDHPSDSIPRTGSVDPPAQPISSRVTVAIPQQDSPSWGTCLYQLAEAEKAKQKALSSGTDVTSRELSEAGTSSSANASVTQTGQASAVVSQQTSPGRGTSLYHMVQSEKKAARRQRNGSERVAPPAPASNVGPQSPSINAGLPRPPSNVAAPPVLPSSAQMSLGTGSHMDDKGAAPQSSALWGIDFALETGLFPPTSGPTPSSGPASRFASSTPSSLPPPPPSSSTQPVSTELDAALNGVADEAMSEAQITELQNFLVELDNLAGAHTATTQIA